MKRKIGFLAMLAVIMFIAGLGAGSLKYKNIIGNNKNSSGNISITESGSGIIEEQVDNDSGNASAVKDIKETDSASEKSKKRKYLQGVQEPSGSILPGHNTYINGFKRLTKLTYDDVATVTDSKYSFTIGTFYDDEYYHEPLESCGHVGGGFVENGCFCKWAYAYYKDLEVGYTTYNCINRDYSGKHEYIGEIRLVTPRFKTKAGLHVGSSVQDVFDAYPKDIDKTPSEEGGDPCYELYIDGVLTKFFYDEDTQKITSIKLSY